MLNCIFSHSVRESSSSIGSCDRPQDDIHEGTSESRECDRNHRNSNHPFFHLFSDSIIQPPVARTSSDTPRLVTYNARPTEPTSSLKTCMAGGSSKRASPSRKRRGQPKPRGRCPRLQPAPLHPPFSGSASHQRQISGSPLAGLGKADPQNGNAEIGGDAEGEAEFSWASARHARSDDSAIHGRAGSLNSKDSQMMLALNELCLAQAACWPSEDHPSA